MIPIPSLSFKENKLDGIDLNTTGLDYCVRENAGKIVWFSADSIWLLLIHCYLNAKKSSMLFVFRHNPFNTFEMQTALNLGYGSNAFMLSAENTIK